MNPIPKSTSSRRIGVLPDLIGLTVIMSSNAAMAANWAADASTYAQFEYNDNKQLIVENHNPVYGRIFNLQAAIKRETERSILRVAPRVRYERYEGGEYLDADNKYLNASLDYSSERSHALLVIDYSRDTPLTSEFQEAEVVRTNKPRNRWNLSPNWNYQLSERNDLALSFTYLDVQHEDADFTPLVDYLYLIGSARHTYRLSEVSDFSSRIYGSRFDTEDVEHVTNDGGVDFTYTSRLSANTQYSLRLGWHQVTVRAGKGSSEILETEEGNLAGITLTNLFESGTASLSVQNDVEPSGVGNLVDSKKGVFSLVNRITENISNTISLSNSHNRSVGDLSGEKKWEFRQLSWRVLFRLNRYWTIDGTYRYSWQEVSNIEGTADSNALLFTINYQEFYD